MDVRELKAKQTVDRHILWSAAAGVIPVPLVDVAAVAAVQVKMLSELSKLYGIPFSKSTAKSLVAALLGSVTPSAATASSVGFVKLVPVVGPILGTVTMSAFAAAATYAVGRVFITHFESGGTFLDFNPDAVREHFRAEFEKKAAEPAGAEAAAA